MADPGTGERGATGEALVAGVDSSTQSVKVVLCRGGTVVQRYSAPHPDGTECHPRRWEEALAGAAPLIERAEAVSVAAQQHRMVAPGYTLAVTKLDRLARSYPTHVRSPSRPAAVQRARHGRGVESDLIRLRTREGMKVGKAKGPAAWHAAQAESSPRGTPGLAGGQRRVQHRRGRRPVRRQPIDLHRAIERQCNEARAATAMTVATH